ncbi:hypothetical protein [Paenibacillus larvae]|uniref:Uncharacterized protein n=1 Tax=Paenibacillus larvae TaxID=1464 RepID=A0AAP5JS91_9BACL|nr:hypothetical protein [Paenibacillus larvae]AQR79123.1 hypothetical protein BXP28_19735 [Paenibacillus larvae subsp. larvae]MDR5568079.1 hypothetical protein [Paenibacillus larvae]MDR5584433.1 hypothetical protein [Paenibacillus larvae]MDT2251014.1 hypothetical protein [Paenibacillus larvae]MDT2263746.1 hypothetical protein [Paenibacillus larvae]
MQYMMDFFKSLGYNNDVKIQEVFQLDRCGTTIKQELLAGIISFFANTAYFNYGYCALYPVHSFCFVWYSGDISA